MAAADVQHPVDTTYVPAREPPLQRSESQVLKQMKVEQVQRRLWDQQEPVRKLLDVTKSLVASSSLEDIEQQQKTARNIGEDLMEDMLNLDSLANLYQEDRQVRKKALADIEALVEQVDDAKSMLMRRRKELEKASASLSPEPGGPNGASPRSHTTLTTISQGLSEIRLPLELSSQTLPDAYVVSGFTRGLEKEDLRLDLSGSTLKISALRLPTPEEWNFLEKTLQRAPTLQDFLAVGRGVFGQIKEVIKLPLDVDKPSVQATLAEGHLRITLPRKRRANRPLQGSFL